MSAPSSAPGTVRIKNSRKPIESLPSSSSNLVTNVKKIKLTQTLALGSVKIKTMSGDVITIPTSSASMTVLALKRQIEAVDSARFPVSRQRLVRDVGSDDTGSDDAILENDAPVACGSKLALFVADVAPMTLVRDIDGPSDDGATEFSNPRCAVIDSARDHLIVADTDNHRVVALDRANLSLIWQHGDVGRSGTGKDLLSNPVSCALSADGSLLFVLAEGARIVTLSALTGSYVSEHEIDMHLHLNRETQNIDVCAATGKVWIADVCGGRVLCFDPSARTRSNTWRLVDSIGGFGTPLKLAVMGNRLLVSDRGSFGIQVFDTSMLTPVSMLAEGYSQHSLFCVANHVVVGIEDSHRGFRVFDMSCGVSGEPKEIDLNSTVLNLDDEQDDGKYLDPESVALCSATNELYIVRNESCDCGECGPAFQLSIYSSI
jgi:hypothetical protein